MQLCYTEKEIALNTNFFFIYKNSNQSTVIPSTKNGVVIFVHLKAKPIKPIQ